MTTNNTSRISCLLTRPNVKARDRDAVLQKLNNSRNDGAKKLSVLADFDFTITKRWSDEEKKISCPSTYCVIKDSDLTEKRYGDEMKVCEGKFTGVSNEGFEGQNGRLFPTTKLALAIGKRQ